MARTGNAGATNATDSNPGGSDEAVLIAPIASASDTGAANAADINQGRSDEAAPIDPVASASNAGASNAANSNQRGSDEAIPIDPVASASNAGDPNAANSNQRGSDEDVPLAPVAERIRLNLFAQRMNKLFQSWAKQEAWKDVPVITVACRHAIEDTRHLQKSSVLHVWLFGYQFPKTLMIFVPGELHILCSPEKAIRLNALCDPSARLPHNFKVFVHLTNETDLVQRLSKPSCPEISNVNVPDFFSELFAVKDESEVRNIKRASLLSLDTMTNYVVNRLRRAIGTSISHSTLMADTRAAIFDPSTHNLKIKWKPDKVNICYDPIFQSGENFDLSPNAISNDEPLDTGARAVIICALGLRYAGYCANITRTYLIHPIPTQRRAYHVLLRAHDEAINALRPGRRLSAVYETARTVVGKEGRKFLPHLTCDAGHGIGIEFNEPNSTLSATNARVLLKAGMVFNVRLGFQDVVVSGPRNPKRSKFSMLLADTVLVMERRAEILTAMCPKTVSNIVLHSLL